MSFWCFFWIQVTHEYVSGINRCICLLLSRRVVYVHPLRSPLETHSQAATATSHPLAFIFFRRRGRARRGEEVFLHGEEEMADFLKPVDFWWLAGSRLKLLIRTPEILFTVHVWKGGTHTDRPSVYRICYSLGQPEAEVKVPMVTPPQWSHDWWVCLSLFFLLRGAGLMSPRCPDRLLGGCMAQGLFSGCRSRHATWERRSVSRSDGV